jgi:flagellum-specific peptidoglycan hydrolase FlgJ
MSFCYDKTKKVIDLYGADIATAIKGTGLFFPTVVAQVCLEAYKPGSDQFSELAKKYNNYSGIKYSTSYTSLGPAQMDTTEFINGVRKPVKANFAIFSDFKQYIQAYVKILTNVPSYRAAGVFQAKSPEEQVLLLVKGGYSTTPGTQYLNIAKCYINSARDIVGFGKIAYVGGLMGQKTV